MDLKLTPKEYLKLIELAYLGEWMINAHHDPEVQDDSASQVLQRLLAAGPPAEASRDEETGQYYLSTEWIDRVYDTYILDYDDHVFWDELTERLAGRDLARQRGIDVEEIDRDENLSELRPLEEKYRDELETYGIERLGIMGY